MGTILWIAGLLVLALLLAGLEIIIPSGGLLAFMSIAAIAGSVFFAFQLNVAFGWIYLITMIVFSVIAVNLFLKWWPRTIIGRRLTLDLDNDPALAPNEEVERLKLLLNKPGVAKSRMMPSGIVEIDGKRYDAISDGEPIDPGKEIVVVNVQGILITVRKLAGPVDLNTKIDKPAEGNLPEEIEDPFA